MKKQTIIIIFLFIVIVIVFGIIKFSNNDKLIIKEKEYSLTGTTLNLDSVGVNDDEIKIISEKIEGLKNLETLYLGGNNITDKGLSFLSLYSTGKLNVIDLSNNKFSDKSANEFLEKNSFKVVDLSGNKLNDMSTVNFVNNNFTTQLVINRNNIGDVGFKNILKNKKIEYLSIEDNNLTDETLKYLLNDYKKSNLKFLKLKGNKFTKDGIKKLNELKQKKVFETLKF